MSTTSQAGPRPARNPHQARIRRGLALFRERGDEIREVSPGTYRVPGSGGAEYTVRLDAAYCSCPDRDAKCKHLFAVTVCAAKKNAGCRRQHTTTPPRPTRRHTETAPRPREQQDERRRGTAPARHRGGSYGLDPARVRSNLERMGS